jgi:hypothetical protein
MSVSTVTPISATDTAGTTPNVDLTAVLARPTRALAPMLRPLAAATTSSDTAGTTPNVDLAAALSASDSVTAADAVSVSTGGAPDTPVTLADTATGADALTVSVTPDPVALSPYGGPSYYPPPTAPRPKSPADIASAFDQMTVQVLLDVDDLAAGMDALDLAVHVRPYDDAAGADTASSELHPDYVALLRQRATEDELLLTGALT